VSRNTEIQQTFAQASRIDDPVLRREFLLGKIEEIYGAAMARSYKNRKGEDIPNPDGLVALKCVEVVGRWAGYDASANLQAAAEAARAKSLGAASDVELLNQLLDQVPADMLLAALKKREALAALPERKGKKREQPIDTTGESGPQWENPEGEGPEYPV
jgi:hypothetical protein